MLAGVTPPVEHRDVTLPGPGSRTAHALFSAALGRALRELLRLSPGTGPSAAAWAGFAPQLRRIAERQPGALASALRRPTLGTLLRCLRGGDDPRLTSELLATLALELALAGALQAPAVAPAPPSLILCLGAGRALRPPPGPLTITPEGWRAGAASGRIEALLGTCPDEHVLSDVYAPIEGPLALALRRDNSPLADLEAHPEKTGSRLDLGGRPADAWCAGLRAGLALIARHLPELRPELDLGLQLVVPVGYHAERHFSASYQEAIGAVYLGLHPRPLTLAEALIHEYSHNKLYALLEQGALLHNAWAPLYPSPVRPDPRPLHGVLLAAHAFLPVARMLERMRDAGEDVEPRLRQVAASNHAAAATLRAHARPTPLGEPLLAEILRLDEAFRPHWERA